MRRASVVAASFLALGFGTVSFILLFIEPSMGFAGPADYFDPAKVLIGAASRIWLVGDLIYLGFGVALAHLASSSDDHYLRASGLAAGGGFLFIGTLGRVLAELPLFISDGGQLDAAVLGLLSVRFAALRTTVLTLGFFAWRTTRGPASGEASSAAWRTLGYLVLAAAAGFVFAFIPVPPLFAIWAGWLAFRKARDV